MEIFTYDDWYGSVCKEENTKLGTIYYGKLLFMKDCITYESVDRSLLYKEFKSAVEEYVDFCEEINKLPEKVIVIGEMN